MESSPIVVSTPSPTTLFTPTLISTANATSQSSPSVSATPSLTAQPTIETPRNVDDSNQARVIDGIPHNITANAAVWFSFDYFMSDTGERSKITITLVDGNNSGVNFELWNPENINDWWEKRSIGRGTVYISVVQTMTMD